MARKNDGLERARAAGFLNAARRNGERLKAPYAFWCWRLRLPAVWCEKRSSRSKFGRVMLDLFTTSHVLTEQGKAELERAAETLGISARAVISSVDAVWDNVPAPRLEELARAVFRAATRDGSYELQRRNPPAAIVRMFEAIRERASLERSA